MHIVIIGNGIAGISAARNIRKLSDHRITVISAETDHFFSRTALMYIYMGHMKYEHTKPYEDHFWEKNRIGLRRAYVKALDTEGKSLLLDSGERMQYDKLILATGSQPNKFGWPGQDLRAVQGLYSYQDLESMERYSADLQRAVIVGGGLIGIEMAEMFHSRHIPVTFLVREESFWNIVLPPEESAMINREIRANGIDLRLSTELKEILPDENGRARAVLTSKGEEIACQFVGLTAGVHPNIDLVKATSIETDRGILVDEYLQTNVPDVYAIGDCAQLRTPLPGRRGIEAVWYTGKHMGPVVAANVCGRPTPYRQPLWFNSAKFFAIEYQVYGQVGNQVREGEKHLYWEHADGRKSVRIVYDARDGHVLGFNLMGIRYRQQVCEHWLAGRAHIEEVLQQLGAANFDPEFFRQHEAEIVALYNAQNPGRQVRLRQNRGLKGVFSLLGMRA
ncbi:MAG: NAD(P)/FAD-dependent oxidoreductase [Bacteroidetes bacterium]|nr:MAG: NAD(P)/FAD-dependent oxidoreductase [Bacteroidota bacterium]